MSSVQALRNFINERLTAAAGEIFTVFEQTIVQYEEEIVRQRKLLQITQKLQIKFHRTESPQQQVDHQKSSSRLEEEHKAPHIKEEEDVVEVPVADGESDDSLHAVKDLTTQRLTAAAGEIFTLFEQTIVQYEAEIDHQCSLLGIIRKPKIKFKRTELPEHHDCTVEQLFKQEINYCLKQEEPEPPRIKEEPEEPEPQRIKKEQEEIEPSRIKEEPEELEPPQFEEQQELGRSQEAEQLVLKVESDSFRVPSIEEQSFKQLPDSEQLLSCDSEVHDAKHVDSESIIYLAQNKITIFHGDHVNNVPVSEKQAEGEKLSEETSGGIVHKKLKLCRGSETDKKKIACEICGKIYSRQANLLVHMRIHTGEKPYCCKTCGKSFSLLSTLSGHMRTHTGEKPYSCQTCGKSFSQQSSLMTHLRIHTGEKLFSCETCGKGFNQQSHLLRHMRIHTGEKPYYCKICGRRFNVQGHLSRHMKTHTGEKPHSCVTCGKSFSQRGSLLCHIRTHTGEKPYSCITCGKSFCERSGLRNHLKTHTGEKPYACKTCGHSFRQHNNMLRHMNTHKDMES